jgi:hypothetical protein
MSIIKTSFVMALVVFLMPSPPDNGQIASVQGQQQVPSQVDLVSAAGSTVTDMQSFCQRQPGVCQTAGYLMWKAEAKLKYSVKLIYEWANQDPITGDLPPGYANQAVVVDPLTTGSTRLIASNDLGVPSQNTLKLQDLIPAWRGPRTKQAS